MQLDKQLEEDEAISSELKSLNVTGTKLTKQMIAVPINNTILYVEPIYQTMLNESEVPVLKKSSCSIRKQSCNRRQLNKSIRKFTF